MKRTKPCFKKHIYSREGHFIGITPFIHVSNHKFFKKCKIFGSVQEKENENIQYQSKLNKTVRVQAYVFKHVKSWGTSELIVPSVCCMVADWCFGCIKKF